MRTLCLTASFLLAGCTVQGYPVHTSATFTTDTSVYAAYDEPAVDIVGAELAGDPIATVDVFFDQLEPYGSWYDDPTYGWAFVPSIADYTPYSNGYWSYADVGMIWISYDPFGWATDHYGRWIFQTRWIWIPDTTWGPAWVSWRTGDGWIGWAPCGYGSEWYVPDVHWRFVAASALFAADVRIRYVTRDIHRYVRDSVPIARYRRHGDHLWAAGPSEDWMRRNGLEIRRGRFEPAEVGRFDGRRRDDFERHAREREREWKARWPRFDEVRRDSDARERRQLDEQTRMVDEQRRILTDRRRVEQQRRSIDQQRTRARDDSDRRRLQVQQRQLEVDQRRLQDEQRDRGHAEERARQRQRDAQLRLQEARKLDAQRRQLEAQKLDKQRQQQENQRLERERRKVEGTKLERQPATEKQRTERGKRDTKKPDRPVKPKKAPGKPTAR